MRDWLRRYLVIPICVFSLLEVAAEILAFGGARNIGLGVKAEYAAWAVFFVGGAGLSACSGVVLVRFHRRKYFTVMNAAYWPLTSMLITFILWGLQPVMLLILLLKTRVGN